MTPPPRAHAILAPSVVLALVALLASGVVAAQQVSSAPAPLAGGAEGLLAPGWEAGFGAEPGLGGPFDGPPLVLCSAVYDDGSGAGPLLYVGGSFESAGGRPAQHLARWDGSEWTNVGDANGTVRTMAVHDDGTGKKLYVGGVFTSIGGAAIPYLARYDGATWSPVGAGVDAQVTCLHRFVDGCAAYLGVGGDFTTAGGAPASRAALYAAGSWFAFGDGFDDEVYAFAIHDGSIYAGGAFSASGATPVAHLARWTGSAWEDVDGGTDGAVPRVPSVRCGEGWLCRPGDHCGTRAAASRPLKGAEASIRRCELRLPV